MTIAYQGVAGAFGYEACVRFVPEQQPHGLPSFGDVIEAVEQGSHELGMLPWDNMIAGPVFEVQDLFGNARLRLVSKFRLPVRIHLFCRPESDRESITTVLSHPMALAQCAASLKKLGFEAEAAANTAIAAKQLNDRKKAVLASESAGALYGLKRLLQDLQDQPDNYTDFILVATGE